MPTLRSATPADLEAIHRLHTRIERHDRLPLATPVEEFTEWRDEPHLDLAADTRLAEEDGALVGWARIWHQPSGEREERAYLFGGVAPERRGRGIGAALLAWQIERAEALLSGAPPGLPRYLRAHAYASQAADQRLYRRFGMDAVRWLDELLRDLDRLPAPVAVPAIAIEPWDPARSEETRAVMNQAFADHWGFTPRDSAAWAHEIASFGTRLDLSFLALESGRVVGGTVNGFYPGDEMVHGRRDGWIRRLGVIRSHRGRGIATALIAASLAAFRDAGFTHSALGVDSASPTGAHRLYETLGYRPQSRIVVFERKA